MIAAHTVHINDAEIDILKRENVGSAHCPQSNMKFASGVAPVPQMLLKDLAVGLGTDGAASNNDLSIWEEMDTAAKLHKVFSGDPKVVTAAQAFEMATIRGARALHLEKSIGSIETGKRADIVIVDFDDLNQTPFYNIYSHLVYATKADDVRDVIINGKDRDARPTFAHTGRKCYKERRKRISSKNHHIVYRIEITGFRNLSEMRFGILINYLFRSYKVNDSL